MTDEKNQNFQAKALSMAVDMAMYQKFSVLYSNFNMTDIQIVMKIISMETGIKLEKIKEGSLTSQDYRDIVNCCEKIYEMPFSILDFDGNIEKVEQIKEIIKKISEENKIKIMFIDYEEKKKEIIKKLIDGTYVPIVAISNKREAFKFYYNFLCKIQ
jgi:replicative DNA helicase